MGTKRNIKDSLKEYLNWCVGRLLLGGSRDDTVRGMVDAISDEMASGGGIVSQDQLDQTVKDITQFILYHLGNFNPDSKFPYLGMGGVNDNSNEIGAGYSGSSAGGNFNGPFIKFGQTSNYMTELYNRHDQDVFQIRRMVNGEWQAFVNLWHSGNFNPDNYLPLTGNKTITGSLTVANGFTSGIMKCQTGTYPQLQFEQTNTGVTSILFVHTNNALIYRPVDPGSDYTVYHSGNFNPSSKLDKSVWDEAFEIKTVDGVRVISAKLDFLSVAGISAYATGPSSGGGGGGLNIPAYIFPGDPSKLGSSASSTHITSILGTAIDLLDAFNNGRVFISKTVTLNEVQVPSDITYSLLKSIDPDNPTIFQIIMSTVVWGHYIEITIDFENNEYQAISNTINGIIGVNNTGTTD